MTSPAGIQISKVSLTKAGVVVLQTFFIGLIATAEVLLRHGIGVFTGEIGRAHV